ncbi:MAG: single-stranded DNA-binding protein [Eubacteriales bacterium]|nr:single-stranded DNA-binding protein [Eubacteriales bacterium]
MNKIFLIGNLTFDPETRTTPNGASVCSFNIAVNRRFANANGEKQTDFFRISAWRGLGENCQRFLTKGKKVAVVGELTARTYEAKDGTTRISLEVNADEVEFLSPRGEGGSSGGYSGGSSAEGFSTGSAKGAAQDLSGFTEIAEDELPF